MFTSPCKYNMRRQLQTQAGNGVVPQRIKRQVLERPEAFRKLAELDDKALDLVQADADHFGAEGRGRKVKSR